MILLFIFIAVLFTAFTGAVLFCSAVCSYALHLYALNDRAANGVKAKLLLRLEGHEELLPQRTQTCSPWLDVFQGVALRPGARLSALVTASDVGFLSTLRMRCPKKLSSVISAVEVTHASTGETAFFALAAAKRKPREEPAARDGEVTVIVAREPPDSSLYRRADPTTHDAAKST